MQYDSFHFENMIQQHEAYVNELLKNRKLVREANQARRAQAETRRRTWQCLVGAWAHEVLPTAVANVVAQPCVPCCSPGLAA